MDSGSPPSQGRQGLVARERQCHLDIACSGADPHRLADYLALVDRPLSALLARDRLRRLGEGFFTYQSRPFRLLRYELVPSLELRGVWEGGGLHLSGDHCRIVGLGRWENSLDFELSACLQPTAGGIAGMVGVSVVLPTALPSWSHSLAAAALEQVLDRIERRMNRGLRKDLLTWMWDQADSG